MLLGWAACFPASAQTAYTLEECVEEAVNNNLKLRNADNEVRMSEARRKEAFVNYFPTLSAMGGGFVSNK